MHNECIAPQPKGRTNEKGRPAGGKSVVVNRPNRRRGDARARTVRFEIAERLSRADESCRGKSDADADARRLFAIRGAASRRVASHRENEQIQPFAIAFPLTRARAFATFQAKRTL